MKQQGEPETSNTVQSRFSTPKLSALVEPRPDKSATHTPLTGTAKGEVNKESWSTTKLSPGSSQRVSEIRERVCSSFVESRSSSAGNHCDPKRPRTCSTSNASIIVSPSKSGLYGAPGCWAVTEIEKNPKRRTVRQRINMAVKFTGKFTI